MQVIGRLNGLKHSWDVIVPLPARSDDGSAGGTGFDLAALGLVSYTEFLGGLALIAGAFVSVASVLLIINMLVALFTVHLPNGFNFINFTGMTDAGPQFGMPGYEVNLLYIGGLLALLLGGPTHMSVDQKLAEKKAGGGSSR